MKKTSCDYCGVEVEQSAPTPNMFTFRVNGKFGHLTVALSRDHDICGRCADVALRLAAKEMPSRFQGDVWDVASHPDLAPSERHQIFREPADKEKA